MEVMTVDSLLYESGLTYVGTVESSENLNLGFRTGGKLLSIDVSTGDYVRAGQVLATVDSITAYNSVVSARAALRQAEDAYSRLQRVRDAGGVTESQWQEMLTRLDQARSLEAIAANELSHCTLTAPFSGVVGSISVVVGQTMLPMQTVLTLVNTGSLNAEFAVAEHDLAAISKGDRVDVELTATGVHLPATLIEKSLVQNTLTHTYKVKARLHNAQGIMHNAQCVPGMACKVHVRSANEEIVVPAHCLHLRPEGQTVWVVKNGKACRRLITTSHYTENGVAITDGLTLSDTIITAGYQKLYENAKLTMHN